MILRDRIEPNADGRAVFDLFEPMASHDLGWHPDHKLFRWVRGRGLRVGHVFCFEEVINGKLLKKEVVFTRVEPFEHIEFAPTNRAMRWFLPRRLLRAEPLGAARRRLVAEIHMRIGPLAAWPSRRDIAAVREHMRVEGVDLERIVEAAFEARP